MLKAFIGLLTVCYPFLVYFAADHLQPRYLALALAAIFLLRWLQQGRASSRKLSMAILAPAGAAFLLVAGLANEEYLLLAYPVFVSAVFFALFFYSFLNPPTVVEKLARLSDPDLPPKGVAYTRKVTLVWCGFFAINALISAGAVWYGERWVWSLYNGCISYVLMGTLMGAEMMVRRQVRKTF